MSAAMVWITAHVPPGRGVDSGSRKTWHVLLPAREPALREQNLIGNVIAHIAEERERQKGWSLDLVNTGNDYPGAPLWWGP